MVFSKMARIKALAVFCALLIAGSGGGPTGHAQEAKKVTKLKVAFVAYNWLYRLGTPTYPVQSFVVDVSPDGTRAELAKLLYFPKPSSTLDGVAFLDIQSLIPSQSVEIMQRRPNAERSQQCGHFQNFVDDGTRGTTPQLVFRSFQYSAFMTFEFDTMECYELVSVSADR